MKVLITGGAGFIGSTIASAWRDRGRPVVVVDDFSTGRREFAPGSFTYQGDVADPGLIDTVFSDHPDIGAVVHCAAKLVVPESMDDPLGYYQNNVGALLALLRSLDRVGCRRLLFSSSAAIYRPGPDLTVDENSPIEPLSPYAATKAMAERILADCCAAGQLRSLSLRYFNPVGADPHLRTGFQQASPTHVLGRLIDAHGGGSPFLITGTDWGTRDGTGIRDYIHVWDLALAHVAALERFDQIVPGPVHQAINLGSGRGTTVRELVSAFQSATGDRIEVTDGPARAGDVIGCYARTRKAESLLGWRAELPLQQAIVDSLAWMRRRPQVLPDFAPESATVP